MGSRRYTDQQFRDAVADPTVRTIADLCRRLGILPRGANYDTVRAVAAQLRLELPAPATAVPVERRHRLGQRAAYTDQQLLDALADPEVTGYPALCERLGVSPLQATYRRIRRRAAELGTAVPESWSTPGPSARARDLGADPYFDPAALAAAVTSSTSKKGVLEALNVPVTSTNYAKLRQDLARTNLDVSHFDARAAQRRSLEPYLVAGRLVVSSMLRRRLIHDGYLVARCSRCQRERWNGTDIPLELDHVNGDRLDNRLENLRLLCPNCHAQTPTYRGRNIGRPSEGRR